MKDRDPFSSAYFFASSLAKDPIHTLEDTWKGIRKTGELKGVDKFTTPAIGALGLTMVFLGASTLDPIAIGAGLFATSDAGGRYLELGRDTGPKVPPALAGPWGSAKDGDDAVTDKVETPEKDKGGPDAPPPSDFLPKPPEPRPPSFSG